AWKFLREHRDESKKRVLRGKVKELAEFLHAALPATGAERIKNDAEHEYAETISKLSDICDAKKRSTPVPVSSRNWIQRCFLLYVPQRPLAWIPQTIFFIFLSFTVLGFIGVAADPHDPDIGSGILGLSIFAALTALIRFWAVRANATSADPAASP